MESTAIALMPAPINTLPLNIDVAWQQVLARDARADLSFVYAVATTGIFCRPSCPSRKPARQNVHFFPDTGSALSAGYRACQRCRPAGVHTEAAQVADLCAYLRANLDRMVTLKELGERSGLSPFTVQRIFERVLGVSPRHYQMELRAQSLREALTQPNRRVTDAVYDAGYSASSRAYQDTDATLGMSPRSYRAGGAGEKIAYTTAECALGLVLVAATERGVCRVSLGDSAEELAAELRRLFPKATLVSEDQSMQRALEHAVSAVLSSFTEHPASLDLSLDLRATAFQQRVWRALREIPRGETRSYSEVALALGTPRAVRAVAQACARNPVALLIPCHRVVGQNGALTGYRWGKERKQKLLSLERGEHV